MNESVTISNEPAETVPLPELPEGFLPRPKRPTTTEGRQQTLKGMLWYDMIIDDLFANPGTTLKACAGRLGKWPSTLSLICNSDLFKARYAQRRAQFNRDLDQRMTGKLTKLADITIDSMIEKVTKQRDSIPTPILNEVMNGALDRLGYTASRSESPSVVVNNHNNVQAVAATQVSGESLARARAAMKQLNDSQSNPGPVEVEGRSVRAEGES